MRRSLCQFAFLIGVFCLPTKNVEARFGSDPHTFSEPDRVRSRHLDLYLKVDFADRRLTGWVRHVLAPGAKSSEFKLDTSDLEIERVTIGRGERRDQEHSVRFTMGVKEAVRGTPLIVPITSSTKTVTIYYRTAKSPAGLVWLDPDQTTDKINPFLFSNSEPILGRSWIPTQDSPAVRVTYSAEIEVPKGLMALMSAKNPQSKSSTGQYRFKQTRAIPSYLIALAVGDLSFQPIGPRTGVYAEPSELGKAAKEFEDLEKITKEAEKFFGRFKWGRYDLLIMPNAFPLGGMENPELTFVMPTVVTGTKSQIFVVTHELSHSWTGNVATNATWNDLWLNEGWTTFAERELLEKIYGRKQRELVDFTYHQALEHDLATIDPSLTRLRTQLGGHHSPEDAFSWVPYEKGYYFISELKRQLGAKSFARLTRNYIRRFSFKPVSTATFLRFVANTPGGRDALKKANFKAWIDGAGLPTSFQYREPESARTLRTRAEAWLKGGSRAPEHFDFLEKAVFLKFLPRKVNAAQLKELNTQWALERNPDPELESEWLIRATRGNYPEYRAEAEAYFAKSNRRKTLLTLIQNFRACIPDGRDRVRALVANQRSRFFPPIFVQLKKAVNAPLDPSETCE